MVSLYLGWENFKWLQVVGFAFLIYGTFLFNDVVPPPPFPACIQKPEADAQVIINSDEEI